MLDRIFSSARRRLLVTTAIAVPLIALAIPASATHSWNGYHWKRTAAEISPPVGDNVTSVWDSYLAQARTDWNQSTVINSPLVPGTSNRSCRAVAGTIQVCNRTYGNNGWLGIATIWLASDGHISQGTTKLNDTYFNTATYNTPSWRALVTCQEIGHDYGLGHQDEDFSTDNTTSCMDYTSQPQGNEHPDAHDYEQLLSIYNHIDSAFGASGAVAQGESGDTPAEWGRPTAFLRDGRPHVFERVEGGRKVITHVFWALGEGPRGNR